jgi:AcrR family transcriptional regulator
VRKPAGAAAPLIWTQPPPLRQRSLGREEIVAAAIALADEAGPAALTMKAVAARLGPYTAMALYRYVYNKDGLVDLMLDAATAEIPLPAQPGPDWRADLRGLAAQTRQMTKRHPWYAVLFHTRPPVGPHMMQRLEFMLAVLTARGASTAAAMTYAALIDRHIFGSALQEAEEARMSRRHRLDDDASLMAAMAAVHDLAAASGRYPHLTSWLARPTGPPADQQFDLGLGFLLDGIAAQLPARPPGGPSSPREERATAPASADRAGPA